MTRFFAFATAGLLAFASIAHAQDVTLRDPQIITQSAVGAQSAFLASGLTPTLIAAGMLTVVGIANSNRSSSSTSTSTTSTVSQ